MSKVMPVRGPSADGIEDFQEHPWRAEIRLLFFVAACVFTATVLIGMVNGQRVIQLSHDVLLTHVHAGTLGWITLGVFAVSLWLFGAGAANARTRGSIRWLSILAAAAVPLYVLAFLSGNYVARAVFGVPVLVAILAFFGWVIARARGWSRASGASGAPLGIARLALVGALLTLALGGLLGVLLQVQFAAGASLLPEGAFTAHPSALVTGYLALMGMAVSEWRLRPAGGRDRGLALTQIACFFASGLLIAVAFLLNVVPLLAVNSLLLLVGTLIYLWRFAGRIAGAGWLRRSSARFFAASGVFIVVNMALTIFLTAALVTGIYSDETVPLGMLLALDHTMFIGVMTNALFGLVRDAGERPAAWPWVHDAVFWGMNVGLAGFVIALISGADLLIKLSTPVMGVGILLGIAVYAPLLIRQRSAVPVRATS